MRFFRRHRVVIVVLGLGILIAILVGYRIKKQQAVAVPRRQVEIVVGVTKPILKDLDVKLAYTADVLPNKQVAIFPGFHHGAPLLRDPNARTLVDDFIARHSQ